MKTSKTIDHIKKIRTVSDEVKAKRKEFNRIKKLILKALDPEPKSIPQLAKEIDLSIDVITFHLMTLRKYGDVETGELDDMDEYFSYKLKQKE
ncbi:MAG: hypothetical protein B6I20_00390 [Bacteroidetes bacterium 4572_117]|nr:MAG: hypothetical protein B6I20_00390 [Bacteroidetes bacterium 4572_117]